MVVDEVRLREARESGARWADAQRHAELAKADYHHAVRRLHFAGASLREIAEAFDISHQRVHQIIGSSGGGTGWKVRKRGPGELACTFCGLPKAEVSNLIAGPGVHICNDCVALARQIVYQPQSLETPRTHLDPVPAASKLQCSFCRKTASKVDALVAGPGVRICDRCIRLCDEIITAESSH